MKITAKKMKKYTCAYVFGLCLFLVIVYTIYIFLFNIYVLFMCCVKI